MQQRERTRTLARLKKGEIDILVATDVAARGIDVAGITHVVNFDLPKFAEDYVHRIGRTGRAGREGIAISFAAKHEVPALRRIEKFIGRRLNTYKLEGLEARFEPKPLGSGRPGDKRNAGRKFGDRPRDGGKRFDERRPTGERFEERRTTGERFDERRPMGDRSAAAGKPPFDRKPRTDRKPAGEEFGNRRGAGERRQSSQPNWDERQPDYNSIQERNAPKPRKGNFKGVEVDTTVYSEQPRLTLHAPLGAGGNRRNGGGQNHRGGFGGNGPRQGGGNNRSGGNKRAGGDNFGNR
jgi:superfamily II DNA/RNA helicase